MRQKINEDYLIKGINEIEFFYTNYAVIIKPYQHLTVPRVRDMGVELVETPKSTKY